MTRALTRTRTAALITVILAVFFFAQAQEARADTIATPNGVGVGRAVDGTVGGTPRQLSFAGLIRTDIGGTETWTYCIDINNLLQMDQPYAEGDWSQANVANLANIARILEQHPADATASSGNAAEAAAVQAAIWHFSDGFDLTAPADVLALYTAIVADADANPVSEPTTSLEITPSQRAGTAGDYLEVTVTTTATGPVSLAVTPSNGAELVTCDAAHTPIGSTIAGPYPARICLYRPSAGGPVELTATASATVGAGRVFLRDGSQKIVLAASRTVQSKASATATWREAPVNHAPTVSLPCAEGGFVFGETARFTAVGLDVDGDLLSYTWKLNSVSLSDSGSSISLTLREGDVLSVVATDSKGAQSAPATLAHSCGHAKVSAPPAPHVPTTPSTPSTRPTLRLPTLRLRRPLLR